MKTKKRKTAKEPVEEKLTTEKKLNNKIKELIKKRIVLNHKASREYIDGCLIGSGENVKGELQIVVQLPQKEKYLTITPIITEDGCANILHYKYSTVDNNNNITAHKQEFSWNFINLLNEDYDFLKLAL